MKKRTFCVLLVLLLSFSMPVTSYSEESDALTELNEALKEEFRRLDLETLMVVRDSINEVISEKGGNAESDSASEDEGEPISAGVYEAGKDIKPGTYVLSFTKMTYGAIIYVYDSREEYDGGKSREHYITVGDTSSYTIKLDEGNILVITLAGGGGKITISPISGSWVP